MKLFVLPMITLLSLTACTTVPKPVQVMEVCPAVPMLELDLPPDAQGRSFLDRMQRFLSGSLETQTDYSLHSTPAKLPTIQ